MAYAALPRSLTRLLRICNLAKPLALVEDVASRRGAIMGNSEYARRRLAGHWHMSRCCSCSPFCRGFQAQRSCWRSWRTSHRWEVLLWRTVSTRMSAWLCIAVCRVGVLACSSFKALQPSEATGAREGCRVDGSCLQGEQRVREYAVC